MRKLITLLTFFILVPVFSANAHEARRPAFIQNITSTYLSATGGGAWHNDIMFGNQAAGFTNLDYNVGWAVTAAVGMTIYERWRFEVEGAFRRHSLDTITLAPPALPARVDPAQGHVRDATVMVNGFLELPIYCQLGGYVGGGVGISFNERESCNKTLNTFTGNSDQLFAFQVMPGLVYKVNDTIALTAGYRFFATSKPSRAAKSVDYPIIHTIEVGIRFNLM